MKPTRHPPASGRVRRAAPAVLAALLLAGCDGVQSALAPAGREAEDVATLWWWMVAGGFAIWTAVVGVAVYATRVRPEKHSERAGKRLIVGGGAVFPTVVLTGLLVYALGLLPEMLAPAPEGALRITVSGEQWWWRVRYLDPDAPDALGVPAGGTVTGVAEPAEVAGVELANELRLPVGERVQLVLSSPDVIHSFWVPSIAGKIDMIPGRITHLALQPTRTGVFRGQCAEYCGASHALMAFQVVVMERPEFDAWLAGQREPAVEPATPEAERGRELFLSNGCGACHTVRGTEADGGLGPDLTHVASRLTLGAGTLTTTPEHLLEWVAETERLKPGVHMPSFGLLPEAELRALSRWLAGLE